MIVDFNHVPPEQFDVHDRLINWARWARSGNSGNVHPMFRQYRNDYWEPAPPMAQADTLDAVAVQKVMKDIPEKYRMAVQWCYILQFSPTKVCQQLGVNKEGLMALIHNGRTMIKNRLTVRKNMVINPAT